MKNQNGSSAFGAVFGILTTAIVLAMLVQGPGFLKTENPVESLAAAYGVPLID